MRILVLVSLLLPPLLVGCGDEFDDDSGVRQPDPSLQPGPFWDPGEEAPEACAYGYGEACPEAVVDCDDDPCRRGECISSATGTAADYCLCDRGYAGELCDRCAPSYEPDGLTCIFRDPCGDGPCLFGTCRVEDESASCDCHPGYAGDLCDRCAAGYHVEALQCVSD